ncbi:hypothetical protein [Rhizobium sp. EC-SD404]|uniref:hypothetical protein n=1 Tax=Rhizobium sp. EC-SD404 TaxID=2038389 RepID=UPI0012568C4E|nr:hypothetical protein [Rhizobium sp. EC-SD404]VVT34338.1 conserved hypothetical protein [Rhizobium sp. EC-SD404]
MLALSRIIIAAVAVFALGLLVTWIRQDGADDSRRAVEKQNNEAINNADLAGLTRRECVDAGGVYDFATGRCRRPE